MSQCLPRASQISLARPRRIQLTAAACGAPVGWALLQIYTILMVAPQRLTSEVAFVEQFFTRDLRASRHGYVFATFSAAAEFLVNESRHSTLLEELGRCPSVAPLPHPVASPRTPPSAQAPSYHQEALDGLYTELYDEWFEIADTDRDGRVRSERRGSAAASFLGFRCFWCVWEREFPFSVSRLACHSVHWERVRGAQQKICKSHAFATSRSTRFVLASCWCTCKHLLCIQHVERHPRRPSWCMHWDSRRATVADIPRSWEGAERPRYLGTATRICPRVDPCLACS